MLKIESKLLTRPVQAAAAALLVVLAGAGSVACQATPAPDVAPQEKVTQAAAAEEPEGDTAEEYLGPRDGGKQVTGTHPVELLMYAQRSHPRAELRGKHPRVFVDEQGIVELKKRASTTHRKLWQDVLKNLRAFNSEPPKAPAQDRRVQNVVGMGIVEAALAYKVEGDKKYLDAAKKWMDAATSYEVWGYTYNKPDVDLAAGHLLYGMGWGYDLLYNDLTEAERKKYRDKLVRQGRLMFEHFRPKGTRSYAYSQNHVYIPTVGLGIAAYALYDEVPEAEEWARLSRVIVGRSLDTYSEDGYFYESFEYFVFAVPWLVQYVSAHEHFTGEALWDRPGFRKMHEYLAHIVLPSGVDVFDFADAFSGSDTRLRKIDDVKRTHPGGKLHSNFNLLHATARWFGDEQAQGVAAHMAARGDVSWFSYMSLLWYDNEVEAAPLSSLPKTAYFKDHGVVFHRTDWSKGATAFAFKCGPPEGHSALTKMKRIPEWHLSSGHAHPDANSYILVSGGEYLTGDSGYSGVPRTDQHNTVLVNGAGQRSVPTGHNAFFEVPYDRLDKITLEVVELSDERLELIGRAADAYNPEIGVVQYERRVTMDKPGSIVIEDQLGAKKAAKFTSIIHSDVDFAKLADGYAIKRDEASLEISFETAAGPTYEVEPNWMTGPGRPGSVQKGERESRGKRLLLSHSDPQTEVKFTTRLQVK